MIKTKMAFLEGQLFSSQSELFENFFNALIDWKKPALQKSHFCFVHVNRQYVLAACSMRSSQIIDKICSFTILQWYKQQKRLVFYYIWTKKNHKKFFINSILW